MVGEGWGVMDRVVYICRIGLWVLLLLLYPFLRFCDLGARTYSRASNYGSFNCRD